MAYIACPSPDPLHPVYAQVSQLPDEWSAIRVGDGWAVLEPSRGWYQIDEIPADIRQELPPPAGTLTSSFLPGLIAANLQNMPGNLDNLPVGWFSKAHKALSRTGSPQQPRSVGTSVTAQKIRGKPKVDRAALRESRLALENALAGVYPDPEKARIRIERFCKGKAETDSCIKILQNNPQRFGTPHPIRIRWWSDTIGPYLKDLQEILS